MIGLPLVADRRIAVVRHRRGRAQGLALLRGAADHRRGQRWGDVNHGVRCSAGGAGAAVVRIGRGRHDPQRAAFIGLLHHIAEASGARDVTPSWSRKSALLCMGSDDRRWGRAVA